MRVAPFDELGDILRIAGALKRRLNDIRRRCTELGCGAFDIRLKLLIGSAAMLDKRLVLTMASHTGNDCLLELIDQA